MNNILEIQRKKISDTKALNVSATKFWGVEPNQIGNFCVAGHNFKNKNMFRNLKKLNERKVTLITCTTDSKQRIVVKAKET